MDAALKAGSSAGVYAARDALVAEYADQAEDRDLLARMTGANDLIRKAVTVDPSGRPGETEPHPDPLGPPTTLVLRARPGRRRAAAADGPLVFALADGIAYGLDGATGAPLWQVPVGLVVAVPAAAGRRAAPSVLVVDARHDELVRLDVRTGALVWRQALGEPVADPPLVLGNQVIQATPVGQAPRHRPAHRRAPGDGRPGDAAGADAGRRRVGPGALRRGREGLPVRPRPATRSAARRSSTSATPPGSVLCPPARVGRYLVVAENHRIDEGRWRVFLLDEAGTRLSAVQQVPVAGWTWGTPALVGLGDLGGGRPGRRRRLRGRAPTARRTRSA